MSTEVETSEFKNFVASFAQEAANKMYRNGYAVFLYTKVTNKKEGMKYAASVLDECFVQADSSYLSNENAIYSNLRNLESRLFNLKKSLKLNWNNNSIQNFLLQPLKAPVTKKRQLPLSASSSVDLTSARTQDKFLLPKVANQQSDSLPQAPEKQLKTDCEKCSKRRKFYMMAISELKVKLRSSRKTLREMSKNYNVRVVNQNLKRKDASIDKLRRERKALKIENLNLKLEVNILKSLTGKENVQHTTQYDLAQSSLGIETLRKEIQIKEERIQELESDVDNLKWELTQLQEQISVKKIITPGDPKVQFQAKSKKRKHDVIPEDLVLRSQEKEKTSNHGWWQVEKFTDIPANVAIEIEEQTYITVLDNGALELWNHKNSGEGPTIPADVFTTFKTDNSKIAFKSVNGKYWSLQTDGRVVSIAETIGTREQFEPLFQDGKLALIGCNNCFLSYNEDGDIICEICTADPKIWFKLIKLRSNVAGMKDLAEGDLKESKDAKINTFKALNHCMGFADKSPF